MLASVCVLCVLYVPTSPSSQGYIYRHLHCRWICLLYLYVGVPDWALGWLTLDLGLVLAFPIQSYSILHDIG